MAMVNCEKIPLLLITNQSIRGKRVEKASVSMEEAEDFLATHAQEELKGIEEELTGAGLGVGDVDDAAAAEGLPRSLLPRIGDLDVMVEASVNEHEALEALDD